MPRKLKGNAERERVFRITRIIGPAVYLATFCYGQTSAILNYSELQFDQAARRKITSKRSFTRSNTRARSIKKGVRRCNG